MPTAVERKSQNAVLSLSGNVTEIPIISLRFQVVSPRDPQSGLPTGKRQWRPIVVTKEWDSSSPMLYRAASSNELAEFKIEFGNSWLSFKNASLIDFRRPGGNVETFTFEYGGVVAGQGAAGRPVQSESELTQLMFTYQKITWTWNDGGKTAMDDWESRV